MTVTDVITACPGCGIESSEDYDGHGSCWSCFAASHPEVLTEDRSRPDATTGAQEGATRGRTAVDGATFAFQTAPATTAIWGDDQDVLWATGEPLMIAAPQGVGKTTASQAVGLARIGIRSEGVLGYPVVASSEKLLYIAADRPKQAARSLRRMVNDSDREQLAERLVVWPGPLPFDLTKSDSQALASFVESHGAKTVIIDSLKDIAVGLSDDAVGAKVNLAIQACIATGVEVLVDHHQRKGNADNKRPRSLDDVYGSTWLTAGCGSVILLWGEPGDPLIQLYHLKSPANEIGPVPLELDFAHGEFTIRQAASLRGLLDASTNGGLEVADAARQIFDTSSPTAAQVEKVRRQLRQLVAQGVATEVPGEKPKDPARYQPARVIPREANREASRNPSRHITNPRKTASREHHGPSRASLDSTPPPFKGGVNETVIPEFDDEDVDRWRDLIEDSADEDIEF